MGISGLLPLLKSIQQQKHLSDLSGKTLAVDAYVWLHKGAYGCAVDLVNGKPTTKYVDYAMHRVRLLRHHGVEPYVVFDGGPLPAKQGTEVERKRKRAEALAKAKHLASVGRHSEARELFVKCVDVTPRHAYQLIKALRAEGVQYIVAPYEADAQLAYLEQTGLVDGVLTEDSDLLVFGCQNVYYKLDPGTSIITCISRVNFPKAKDINLTLWSDKEFRHMSMLSGCDYLEGLKGVGVRTANKLLRKYKHLEGVLKFIQMENGNVRVPKGYKEDFEKAELAFLWQRVWDPVAKRLVHLKGDPDQDWNEEKDAFVGGMLADELALQIALGDVCPISHQPILDINPRFQPQSRNPSASTSTNAKPPPTLSGPMDRFLSTKSKTKKSPARPKDVTFTKNVSKATLVVKGSGMRTLAGEQEKIQAAKMKKTTVTQTISTSTSTSKGFSSSRFFGSKKTVLETPVRDNNHSSRTQDNAERETTVIEIIEEEVEQENGYRSPSPSFAEIRPSSPAIIPSPEEGVRPGEIEEDGWEDEEVLSSPTKPRMQQRAAQKKTAVKALSTFTYGRVQVPVQRLAPVAVPKEIISLVSPSPSPVKPAFDDDPDLTTLAPDLNSFFESYDSISNSQEGSSGVPLSERSTDGPSTLEASDPVDEGVAGEFLTSPISPLGDGIPESDFDAVAESDFDGTKDEEDLWQEEEERRLKVVAKGWRARYSLGKSTVQPVVHKLVRRETDLSPIAQRRKAPPVISKPRAERSDLPLQPIAFNIKPRTSLKQSSPVQKAQPLSRGPKSHVPPRRSFSSIQPVEDGGRSEEEDLDTRATKRRRVSMPAERVMERTVLEVIDPDVVVARSKSRLQAFRFGA